MVWQLVINHPYEETKVLHNYLSSKCDKWLCSEHEADDEINRTHVHYMLVNYKHSKVALTKEINKTWKGSDNFGILTSRPKGEGPYAEYPLGKYVGKGRDDGFDSRGSSYGYSREDITKFVKGYEGDRETSVSGSNDEKTFKTYKERVITRIQYKLKAENPQQAKIRKSDFVKECISVLRERYPQKIYEPRDVFIVIREKLNERCETIGDYKVLDYYDTINRMETPGRWVDNMLGLLEKRKPRV